MKTSPRGVLVRSRPRVSVLDFDREQILALLKARLQERGVREAYLFGSVATGQAGPWSDLDLVIVQETNAPFVERPRAFWELLDLGVGVDILVYTSQEFAGLNQSDSGFWQEFRRSRVRIL
jgi:predicted nucleotidyltransferase